MRPKSSLLSTMLKKLVFSVGLAAAAISAPARATDSPADSVNAFHAVLLDNMRNGTKLACGGRVRQLNPAVDRHFDLDYLSQRALRRQWSTLTAEQRKQFGDLFRELVISAYASNFSGYDGETFTTLDTQDLPDGSRLVHTKLGLSNGPPVSLDYVMRQKGADADWRIVNVVADGVSDLALRATQYDKAFKSGGFDAIITLLQSQIASNKAHC